MADIDISPHVQVDHMFYSGTRCSPTHVLSLPEEETIGSAGLPSPNWPSDHLSLRVHFVIEGDDSSADFGNPLLRGEEIFEPENRGTNSLRKSGMSRADLLVNDSADSKEKKSALAMCCCRR